MLKQLESILQLKRSNLTEKS